ncbi:phosphatidylinositol-3,4,5-trisphosphate 3-phosphatase [Acrasis kona]|uniref:Phosphatidylinositol-3,4,5-trisphosphate 3-phosphatase n=1 Tax=Acrasis kona TaxID=1008807 RepID=A0AAW2Z568_9EUKA
MSLLTNFIRTLVSGDKVRYQSNGYNLDLTYITDRIIAMAFPGENFEGLYRNHVDSVSNMLKLAHGDKYRIYNLSERPYNYEKFKGQVVEFGFPDHHNPPLEYLFEICKNMDEWMNQDKDNVAIVHCLAGRGRTGTVIACYMTYNGLFDNGSEALDFFALKRSSSDRGVQQPSQRRYVQYFSEILHGRIPSDKALLLKTITMYTIPDFNSGGCTPVFEFYTAPTQKEPKKLIFTTFDGYSTPKSYSSTDGKMTLDVNFILQGDIYIRCYHYQGPRTKSKFMFRVSIHTGFVPHGKRESVLRLTKMEIDDAIKSSKFDRDFFMDFTWQRVSSESSISHAFKLEQTSLDFKQRLKS